MAWDDNKLQELRAKYAGGHGGELFDPKFRRVADKMVSKSGTRVAPYAGVPTLLTAPYRPLDADNPDFGDLQVIWTHRSYGDAPDPKYPWAATFYGDKGTLKAGVMGYDFLQDSSTDIASLYSPCTTGVGAPDRASLPASEAMLSEM